MWPLIRHTRYSISKIMSRMRGRTRFVSLIVEQTTSTHAVRGSSSMCSARALPQPQPLIFRTIQPVPLHLEKQACIWAPLVVRVTLSIKLQSVHDLVTCCVSCSTTTCCRTSCCPLRMTNSGLIQSARR